jgi:DNA-binding transcriptional LysR family regulator
LLTQGISKLAFWLSALNLGSDLSRPRLCTDDLFTLRHAALQGIGAVLIPHLAVANDLEGGTLVRLLPSLKAHVGVMHAIFPSRRGMIPAVRALLDLLSETVRLLPS